MKPNVRLLHEYFGIFRNAVHKDPNSDSHPSQYDSNRFKRMMVFSDMAVFYIFQIKKEGRDQIIMRFVQKFSEKTSTAGIYNKKASYKPKIERLHIEDTLHVHLSQRKVGRARRQTFWTVSHNLKNDTCKAMWQIMHRSIKHSLQEFPHHYSKGGASLWVLPHHDWLSFLRKISNKSLFYFVVLVLVL